MLLFIILFSVKVQLDNHIVQYEHCEVLCHLKSREYLLVLGHIELPDNYSSHSLHIISKVHYQLHFLLAPDQLLQPISPQTIYLHTNVLLIPQINVANATTKELLRGIGLRSDEVCDHRHLRP